MPLPYPPRRSGIERDVVNQMLDVTPELRLAEEVVAEDAHYPRVAGWVLVECVKLRQQIRRHFIA